MARTGTYTEIAKTTGTGTTSVTFASIPQTYTDLVIVMNGTASSGTNMNMYFNSDNAGSTYSSLSFGCQAALSYSQSTYSYSKMESFFGYYDTTGGMTVVDIMDYSNTTLSKVALSTYGYTTNVIQASTGLWRGASNAAISSITMITSNTATIPSTATFVLYGIEAYK